MYKAYFGLSEAPFSIAPDPRYLYLSDKHREALAHLIYGVGDQGGFVLLTGEVGTGKTTVCRCLLQQIPDNVDVAFIIHPKLSSNQLLQAIYQELGIALNQGMTTLELVDGLNRYLLDAHSRGRNTILIIDEAQNLPIDILEQLRLLTNLETNEKKLLQLVLIGQPELNELLARPDLRQLAQRVTARYHLEPLSRAEVTDYIQHRLAVAGCRSELFPPATIRRIHRLTQGVPRLINLLCGRVLLGIYAVNGDRATVAIVNNAAREVFPGKPSLWRRWRAFWLALPVAVAIVLAGLWWQPSSAPVPPATAPVWQQQAQADAARSRALAALYADWQLAEPVCDQPENPAGLYCWRETRNPAQLLALNSPAVIELELAPGQLATVYLAQVNGQQAQLQVNGQPRLVPLSELSAMNWREVTWLSRLPADLPLPLLPGQASPVVGHLQRWLKESLAAPEALVQLPASADQYDFLYSHYPLIAPSPDDDEQFAPALQDTVRQLQQQLGLVPADSVDAVTLHRIGQHLFRDPMLTPSAPALGVRG